MYMYLYMLLYLHLKHTKSSNCSPTHSPAHCAPLLVNLTYYLLYKHKHISICICICIWHICICISIRNVLYHTKLMCSKPSQLLLPRRCPLCQLNLLPARRAQKHFPARQAQEHFPARQAQKHSVYVNRVKEQARKPRSYASRNSAQWLTQWQGWSVELLA